MNRTEEWESEHETSEDESDHEEVGEEPRIRDVLRQISNAVPYQSASDLLHSMAAS